MDKIEVSVNEFDNGYVVTLWQHSSTTGGDVVSKNLVFCTFREVLDEIERFAVVAGKL